MKNISFYKIALVIAPLFFIFSCAKEKDITTETTITPPPVENTDIYSVQGIVKDTLGQTIGGVSLKAYFDDLEIETMSDMDGNYEFKIPKSKTEGFIVAAKEQYNRAINSVQLTSNTVDKKIFLVQNFNNNTQNLKLIVDSLFTVRGRAIDETNQPIEGASAVFVAFNTGTFFKIGAIGFTETDVNGNFEIIINQGDYFTRSFSTNYPTKCGSRFGISWTDNEALKDLGNIVLESGNGQERTVSSSITQSDCGSTDGFSKYYAADFRSNLARYEQPLGNFTFDYCDDGEDNVIFVGTHSLDLQDFNGRFYKTKDLPSENEFDICTPSGYFFELYKNGVLTTGTDGNVLGFATSGDITLSTDTEDFVFLSPVARSIIRLPDRTRMIETGFIQGLVTLDANNNFVEEFPGSTSGLFFDYVENTPVYVAGIIQGQMEEKDTGTINEYFVRFRLPYK